MNGVELGSHARAACGCVVVTPERLIEAAVLAEREACAKVAETSGHGCCECVDEHAEQDIAAAIRART